jgi:predicted DNA-binding transcriptional regulator AlpA
MASRVSTFPSTKKNTITPGGQPGSATTDNETTPMVEQSWGLPAREVARLLNISWRHWLALHATGKVPNPVRLGKSVRWRPDELRAWLDAGAPARERWESMVASARLPGRSGQ